MENNYEMTVNYYFQTKWDTPIIANFLVEGFVASGVMRDQKLVM